MAWRFSKTLSITRELRRARACLPPCRGYPQSRRARACPSPCSGYPQFRRAWALACHTRMREGFPRRVIMCRYPVGRGKPIPRHVQNMKKHERQINPQSPPILYETPSLLGVHRCVAAGAVALDSHRLARPEDRSAVGDFWVCPRRNPRLYAGRVERAAVATRLSTSFETAVNLLASERREKPNMLYLPRARAADCGECLYPLDRGVGGHPILRFRLCRRNECGVAVVGAANSKVVEK